MGMAAGNGSPAGDDEEAGYRPMAEINITPMVDVMLVLLIIFMVSAARVSQSKKAMVVSLAGDGALYIREEQVSSDSLVPRLRELRATEGDTVVYVRADKKSNYGDVMDVLGRVGESGYGRVSLLSQPKPKGAP